MNKINVQKIVIGLLVFAVLGIAYQSLVVVPRERIAFEQKKISDAKLEKQLAEWAKEREYKECMSTAYEEYIMDFNGECDRLGKEDGCAINASSAKEIGSVKEKKENRCVTMYK